jgi:hypothetical protein
MALGSTNFPEHHENEFMKRGYLLPDGCKDLADAMKLKGQQHPLMNPLPPETLIKWNKALALKSWKESTPLPPVKGVLTIPKETTVQQ